MTKTNTPDEADMNSVDEVRQILLDLLAEFQAFEKPGNPELLKLHIEAYEDKIAYKIAKEADKARIDPFDFVEPCEPDCSPERHAYHQGQWDMATRMEARLTADKEQAVLQNKTNDGGQNGASE